MDIDLEAYDEDGDTRHLMTVQWPAIPREGEMVIVEGPEFGERRGDTETLFEVHEVLWRASSRGGSQNPCVVLAIPRGHSSFVLKCTCDPKEQIALPTKRCDNCRGRIV